ncbi:MAG: hypothetical protein J7L66_05810 [Anaerolineaceae bacterium]|nr:hypothetical protein [Anaerolineaceae bacterium]
MAKKRCGKFIFTLLILVLFSLASSLYEPISTAVDEIHNESANAISFQEFLWQEHSLILIIQIGLFLAGAFGVAALLPSPNE